MGHLCKCCDMDQQAAKRRPCYRVFYSRFLPSFQNMNLSLGAGEEAAHFDQPHCMNWRNRNCLSIV